MTYAYLGDEYSFSYLAVKRFEGEAKSYSTLDGVLKAVEKGEVDCGVVPIENSIEGTVSEVTDYLFTAGLYITKTVSVPVHHSLVAKNAEDTKIIYSHVQALNQCREYLVKNYPDSALLPCSSTSQALKLALKEGGAAIASCAPYGLSEIAKNIEDFATNTTRFARVEKKAVFSGNKACIMFDTPNKAGALYRALGCFYENDINLTRIESRPHKSVLGRYVFLSEFNFTKGKDGLNAFFSVLQQYTGMLKFLGMYDEI